MRVFVALYVVVTEYRPTHYAVHGRLKTSTETIHLHGRLEMSTAWLIYTAWPTQRQHSVMTNDACRLRCRPIQAVTSPANQFVYCSSSPRIYMIHYVSEKTGHAARICYNSRKCGPILIILSLSNTLGWTAENDCTLCLKKPDTWDIFKYLQQSWTNINNFWYRESPIDMLLLTITILQYVVKQRTSLGFPLAIRAQAGAR